MMYANTTGTFDGMPRSQFMGGSEQSVLEEAKATVYSPNLFPVHKAVIWAMTQPGFWADLPKGLALWEDQQIVLIADMMRAAAAADPLTAAWAKYWASPPTWKVVKQNKGKEELLLREMARNRLPQFLAAMKLQQGYENYLKAQQGKQSAEQIKNQIKKIAAASANTKIPDAAFAPKGTLSPKGFKQSYSNATQIGNLTVPAGMPAPVASPSVPASQSTPQSTPQGTPSTESNSAWQPGGGGGGDVDVVVPDPSSKTPDLQITAAPIPKTSSLPIAAALGVLAYVMFK